MEGPKKRWSTSELESTVRRLLWAKALNTGDEEVASLGFTEIRRYLGGPQGGPPDKTLANVLKAMVSRGLLEKIVQGKRPRYTLAFKLSEEEIERAVLASDIARLEFAARMGVRGGPEEAYTVYGLRRAPSPNFRKALRALLEDAQDGLEEMLTDELQAAAKEVDKALRPGLSRKERDLIQEFLVVCLAMGLFEEPSSQGVATYAHLEKALGVEFVAEYQTTLADFFKGHAKVHPVKTKRLQSAMDGVLGSDNPVLREVGALLAFHEGLRPEHSVELRKMFRRAHLSFPAVLRMAQRLTLLRRMMGITLVVTPKLVPQLGASDVAKSIAAGRAERTKAPMP